MKKVNLKKYYPQLYKKDAFVEVEEIIEILLEETERAERAYYARVNYHKAYLSLDRNDGIEKTSLFFTLSPEEQFIDKINLIALYSAILQLPEKQAHRLYAHYFLGLSVKEIARQEGVNSCTISNTLKRALKNTQKILLKNKTF